MPVVRRGAPDGLLRRLDVSRSQAAAIATTDWRSVQSGAEVQSPGKILFLPWPLGWAAAASCCAASSSLFSNFVHVATRTSFPFRCLLLHAAGGAAAAATAAATAAACRILTSGCNRIANR